jgi:hypothetical protein
MLNTWRGYDVLPANVRAGDSGLSARLAGEIGRHTVTFPSWHETGIEKPTATDHTHLQRTRRMRDRSANWHKLANEARAIAAGMTDRASRQTLLDIADGYQRLARHVAVMSGTEIPSDKGETSAD